MFEELRIQYINQLIITKNYKWIVRLYRDINFRRDENERRSSFQTYTSGMWTYTS